MDRALRFPALVVSSSRLCLRHWAFGRVCDLGRRFLRLCGIGADYRLCLLIGLRISSCGESQLREHADEQTDRV